MESEDLDNVLNEYFSPVFNKEKILEGRMLKEEYDHSLEHVRVLFGAILC